MANLYTYHNLALADKKNDIGGAKMKVGSTPIPTPTIFLAPILTSSLPGIYINIDL